MAQLGALRLPVPPAPLVRLRQLMLAVRALLVAPFAQSGSRRRPTQTPRL
jgi:hypothetical protein